MNVTQFVENITQENSWIRDIYVKHISENHELYDYYFMDEVSSAFVDIANNVLLSHVNSEENLVKLKKILDGIENGLQTNSDEIIRLILVGFIENITPEMQIFSFIREMMPDNTREVLEYNFHLSNTVPSIGTPAGWARIAGS
jgi:hypothetical protein